MKEGSTFGQRIFMVLFALASPATAIFDRPKQILECCFFLLKIPFTGSDYKSNKPLQNRDFGKKNAAPLRALHFMGKNFIEKG